MTTEEVREYRDYWQKKADHIANQLRTKKLNNRIFEHLNDQMVIASDMVDVCELALCQLFHTEERRKGVTDNDD